MALISDEDKEYLKKEFEDKLAGNVKLVMFTQHDHECRYCKETREIVETLAALSDRIDAEVYHFMDDKEKADEYGVDKIPAIAIIGEKDYGVKFYGIPSGYEFTTLIQDILEVSKGETALSEESKKEIAKIDKPLHLQVFVTPTCPYCPSAVHLAHQAAIENDNIKADMIEAIEFPQLSQKYDVSGVPKTVINGKNEFVGAMPEEAFIKELKAAL
ncbi:MAG: thioredoxin family protein [Thermoplasmata archaeon]|nr:thioredoxin family protein [Thermoplasmata archaeon]